MPERNSCLLVIKQPSGLVGGVWFLDDLNLKTALLTEQLECLPQGFSRSASVRNWASWAVSRPS